MDATTARRELLEYGRKIAARGLVVGPGGNTSVRAGDVIYMKASGAAFEDATEKDYIGVDLQTRKVVDGSGKPTCEILMHLACYEVRADVGAVCHTHPPYSLAAASARLRIPPFCPDHVALVGSEIPIVDYVVPAGSELAERVKECVREHNAVLLANHGLVTVGSNMREAYFRNCLVEDVVKSYIFASLIGTPSVLSAEDVARLDSHEAEKYRKDLLRRNG